MEEIKELGYEKEIFETLEEVVTKELEEAEENRDYHYKAWSESLAMETKLKKALEKIREELKKAE